MNSLKKREIRVERHLRAVSELALRLRISLQALPSQPARLAIAPCQGLIAWDGAAFSFCSVFLRCFYAGASLASVEAAVDQRVKNQETARENTILDDYG
jgi:hypothetical protein